MRSGGNSITCLVVSRPREDRREEMFYSCTKGKIIARIGSFLVAWEEGPPSALERRSWGGAWRVCSTAMFLVHQNTHCKFL